MMKKINFPKIVLPVIVLGSSLLNYILLFFAVIMVFGVLGHSINITIFLLFPLTIVIMALSLGIGLVVGVLNVFVRDVGQVVPIVLQAWFWLTPIAYPVNIIPAQLQSFVAFNPMYIIVTAYHDVLVYGQLPALQPLVITMTVSLGLLLLGFFLFRRASAEMVDVL
jgi:lipopolysaccharide transport system permease protein